jgi:hypothetical protein
VLPDDYQQTYTISPILELVFDEQGSSSTPSILDVNSILRDEALDSRMRTLRVLEVKIATNFPVYEVVIRAPM